MRGGVVAVVLGLAVLVGCGPPSPDAPPPVEPYLLVWAGDADRKDTDFLAVIAADPGSRRYGRVLRTIPVKSRGNEPHLLNAVQRQDRRVFGTGLLTGRTYVFDLRDPMEGGIVGVDQIREGRRLAPPVDPVALPNGRVAVTCPDRVGYTGGPRELFTPGGLLDLDANGKLRREVPLTRDPSQTLIVAPAGGTLVTKADVLVTTNHGHGYASTTRGELVPGISVSVWRPDKLTLRSTVILDAGPRGEENLGPLTPRALRKEPVVLVNTFDGGALYVSDTLATDKPTMRLAFDFGAGTKPSGAAVSRNDRWYVTALAGTSRVVSLDIADPWHPKLASTVRLDRDPADPKKARAGGASGLAMSADGQRVAIADYTIDVPGWKLDGDHRVYMLRLDTETGQLRVDTSFRDEDSDEVGIDFNRKKWPHGETGAARPHGMLFVAPAPDE